MFRNLIRGLDSGVVKRNVDDSGNAAGDLSSLRSSMEIMMENVNHLVTKQQVGLKLYVFNYKQNCFIYRLQPGYRANLILNVSHSLYLTTVQRNDNCCSVMP